MISQIPLWSMGKMVGGPALQNTITHLGEQYDVSLVTPLLDYVAPDDMPPGVTVHRFKHRLHGLWRSIKKLGWVTDTLGWYTFRWSAWPMVKQLCERGDVDLVYGYEIYGVPVAKKASRRFGIPMVARYQGTLMSGRRNMKLAGIRFWKHIRALRTRADLYVMTDDGTLGDEVLEGYGIPKDKILFLMNGVDKSIAKLPSHDVKSELGIREDQRMLLTVSRLAFWKRVDRAIRTLGILRERGHDAKLVCVGEGHEEQKLKDFTESLGLSEHVRFVGGVRRDELVSYYRTCDVLLSLYDFSNLCNPVLEGMVLGVPMVVLDTGGTANLVKDGINGVLLEDFSEEAIADATEKLLTDAPYSEALAHSAQSWAEKNLRDWDQRMRVEIRALDELMDEARA